MAGGSRSSGANAPESTKTGSKKKTESWIACVCVREKAEMRSPSPNEQRRKSRQMSAEHEGLMKCHAKMPARDDDHDEDKQDRNREIGQNFPDHDLAPPERGHHQLIERAGFPFAGDRAGRQRDGEQLQNDADDSRHDVIDEALLGIVEHVRFESPLRSSRRRTPCAPRPATSLRDRSHSSGNALDRLLELLLLKLAETLPGSGLPIRSRCSCRSRRDRAEEESDRHSSSLRPSPRGISSAAFTCSRSKSGWPPDLLRHAST